MSIEFTVHGVPRPKGSFRAITSRSTGRAFLKSDNKGTVPWQRAVMLAAQRAQLDHGEVQWLEGPVALALRFFVYRPKAVRWQHGVATKKPDLDKLIRCVKDALTQARVYGDDAQVVAVVARKDYAGGFLDPDGRGGQPRVWVSVSRGEHVPLEAQRTMLLGR